MAVPFNMPDEEECVDEIIRQLQLLLVKLSERRRRSVAVNQILTQLIARVRNSNQNLDDSNSEIMELHHDRFIWGEPITRLPRRRTSSESSCCEDPKTTPIQDNQDCIHQNEESMNDDDNNVENNTESSERSKDRISDGILWRLLPKCIKERFWTTAIPVICVVGWHLFQTIYM